MDRFGNTLKVIIHSIVSAITDHHSFSLMLQQLKDPNHTKYETLSNSSRQSLGDLIKDNFAQLNSHGHGRDRHIVKSIPGLMCKKYKKTMYKHDIENMMKEFSEPIKSFNKHPAALKAFRDIGKFIRYVYEDNTKLHNDDSAFAITRVKPFN